METLYSNDGFFAALDPDGSGQPPADAYLTESMGGFAALDLTGSLADIIGTEPIDEATGWRVPVTPSSVDAWAAETAFLPASTATEVPAYTPSSIYWIGGSSDNWDDSNNWNLHRLPKATDNATINTANGYIICSYGTVATLTVGNDGFLINGYLTINGGGSFANTLSLHNGAFSLGGSVTVSGLFTAENNSNVIGTGTLTLAGGADFSDNNIMTGSGKTILEGTSAIQGGILYLDGGYTLENQGTLTVSGSGNGATDGEVIMGYISGGGALQNDSAGTIDFDFADTYKAGVYDNLGTASFTNAGLVENTGSGTTGYFETHIDVVFTNTGTLAVDAGELALNAGGSSSGTITVAAGALLDFGASGSTAFTISNAVSLAGSLEVDSGVLNTAALTVGQNLNLYGGTLNAGGTLAIGALNLIGGTLALGGNSATVSGLFTDSSGMISGNGTLTLAGGSDFNDTNYNPQLMTGAGRAILEGTSTISNSGPLCLDGGYTLENQGTLVLDDGAAGFYLGYNPFGTTLGGGTLQNDAGGTIDFDSTDSSSSVDAYTGTTAFTNAGLVENTSTYTTLIDVAFTNTGTLAVDAGELALNGGGSSSGTITVAVGALLDFDASGSTAFTFGNAVSIAGSLELGSGVLNTAALTIGQNLNIYGGTLNVGGTLSVGALNLGGGTLALGSSNETISGLFTDDADAATISGTGTLTLAGGSDFDAYTSLMTGTGKTVLQGTSTMSNTALFLDGGYTLENQGTLTLSDTSNRCQIYLGGNPSGMDLGGGTLQNDFGATIVFDFTGAGGGGGVYALTGTTSFTNAGLVENTGNYETQIDVAFTNTGTVSVAAGELALGGGGSSSASAFTIASGAILDFTGGTFTLSGGAFGGTGTVELDSGTLSVTSSTTFAGAVNVHGGTLSLNGGTDIVVGALDNSGGTIALNAGQLDLDGGGSSAVSGIALASGTTLDFDASGSTTFTLSGSGAFGNAGAAIELAGGILDVSGDATFDSPLTVTGGSLTLSSGAQLSLADGGSSSASAIVIGSGAILHFNGGTFTLGGGAFGGTGTVEVDSGTLSVTSSTTFAGAVNVHGGTLSLNGGTDIVDGALDNSGGTIALNAGQLDLDGGGSSTLSGIALASGTTLDFDASGSTTFTLSGTGAFANNSSVVVAAGVLEVNGGMTGTGSVTVNTGATFELNASATTAANDVDIAAGSGIAKLTGGSGNDVFQFGGNFQASDVINGNGGSNTFILDGNYSSGLTFGKTTMVNIQTIQLDDGYSYNLTLYKGTVATGQTMTVNASSLGAGDTLTFSGGGTTGNLVIYGASGGNDVLLGGKGANVFVGDGGGDNISCKDGTDIVVYGYASDSTSTGFDTVSYFNASKDQFSVFSQVTNIDPEYKGGTLDASNFDGDLASDLAGRLTANGAILYEAKSGSYAKDLFLVIDQNGQAGYQAGQDLVIEVPKFKGTLSTSTFVQDGVANPSAIPDIGAETGHHAGSEAHLGEHFNWDALLAGGRSSFSAHVASPVNAAPLHQDTSGTIHNAWNDHSAFGAGSHETFYHSQLDAFSAFSHQAGLTDQFALPHVEYFGT